jgi:hypothetical protein
MSTKKKYSKNHHHSPGVKRFASGEVVQVMPSTKRRGENLDEFQGRVVEMKDGGYVVYRFTEGYGKKWYPFGEVHSLNNSVIGNTPVGNFRATSVRHLTAPVKAQVMASSRRKVLSSLSLSPPPSLHSLLERSLIPNHLFPTASFAHAIGRG